MKKATTDNLFCDKCKSNTCSIIKSCTPEQIDNVSTNKSCSGYKRGEALFHEGGMPLGLFCINSGSVKIIKQASGGKEQIVRIATKGDMVGYRSLLMKQRYTATAIATEDSKVCLIPREEFYKLTLENHKFYDAVIQKLCEELEDSHTKIADIAYKPVRGRLAEALLLLSQANGDNIGEINLTRDDLASFVGTVKETAIRILAEFKDEGLIVLDKRTIKLINVAGLERISNIYD
jgi:CRP-like cAMP-binding protein